MSHLVIARKYRPLDFSAVSGQSPVTKTLANAIKRSKVAHAYLFCGPRGVGKTSIARIFAKSLNCEKGPSDKPCLKCSNCIEIADGSNLAVREIDGASHNSVENVRELIDSFRMLPPPGSRFKIYIIDEVHMLSMAAFNALLKSLEEPPPNTVFILATTEVHKIPITVLSRCQRFDLRALPLEEVELSLQKIAAAEKLQIEDGVYKLIARLSEGSMRDAQSILERIRSYCENQITLKEASEALGVVAKPEIFKLSEAIFLREPDSALSLIDKFFSTGIDPGLFLKEFAAHFRELLLAKFGGEKAINRIGLREADAVEALRQAAMLSREDLLDIVELARSGADEALRSQYIKYALEALVVRLATREPLLELAAALKGFKPAAITTAAQKKTEKSVSPLTNSKTAEEGSPAAKSVTTNNSISWLDFVNFVRDNGQNMLLEHLKRMSVLSFTAGNLEVQSPEFTAKYFGLNGNKAKLESVLKDFSKIPAWKISIVMINDKAAAGSILEQEQRNDKINRENKKRATLEHSNVQALKDLFPGGDVEIMD